MSKDRDLTEVVACRQARQPALEKGTPPNFYVAALQKELAASVRAPAILFLGSQPAAADFNYTLNHVLG